MSKKIKPGQFYWHNGSLFRACKRANGCEGCSLNSFYVCPNIKIRNNKKEYPNCELNNIIFKKV